MTDPKTEARLPRDLVTILRTEAKNQRTPPIDYVIAEDGGRMVHRPDPDIAMAELLEEAASALAAKDAELARRDMQLEASAKVALDLSAQLAEARKALDAVKAENVKLRHIADEQIRAEFAARQALKHLQASDDWYYQNRPIVEIAKEASGFEEALEVIAGSHWERVGYCQSDVEDVPDLTAVEAQSHARATLQRFRAARRALEGGE